MNRDKIMKAMTGRGPRQRDLFARANSIIQELLKSEFHNIKRPVVAFWHPLGIDPLLDKICADPEAAIIAFPHGMIRESLNLGELDVDMIIFNSRPRAKKLLFKLSDKLLRELLRHELLHIDLGEIEMSTISDDGHHSQRFVEAALARRIEVDPDDVAWRRRACAFNPGLE